MRRIQTWNGRTWIDASIADLPLGNNVIKIVEVEESKQVLKFRDIPIHVCSKAPIDPQLTFIDSRLIGSEICPFCQEEINVPRETRKPERCDKHSR